MQIISFVSGSGGCGKSSLIGNLAHTLSSMENPVVAIDLDPGHRLGMHLFIPERQDGEPIGLPLKDHQYGNFLTNFYGVRFQSLGYGLECEYLGGIMQKINPSGFQARLVTACPHGSKLMLVDTSRMPSLSANLALAISHLVIGVITPHPGVIADIKVINEGYNKILTNRSDEHHPDLVYLWNLIDSRSELSCDIINIVRQKTNITILPYAIHRDENYREAIAKELPLSVYAYECQANRDIAALSRFLKNRLNMAD